MEKKIDPFHNRIPQSLKLSFPLKVVPLQDTEAYCRGLSTAYISVRNKRALLVDRQAKELAGVLSS